MSEKRMIFLPYKLHLRHLLFALAEKISVTVLLPPEKSLPKETKLHGIRINYIQFGAGIIKRFSRAQVRTLKYVKALAAILDEQDFDVLVTCEFYHWYTLQCITYRKRRKDFKLFVISETKRWPTNKIAYLFKRILLYYFRVNLKHVGGVFVYTQAAKEFLAKYAPEANVTLLPAPTNTELFKPKPDKQFCPDGQLRLLMNARYSAYKRHKDLFTALAQLKKDGKQVRLTCVSRGDKGKEIIVNLAEQLGVLDAIDFLDPLSPEQMPELYYSHDVLVLPSYNEAIGMVVPEAMACGTPTVTTDTVGANVYVSEGDTGFIYKTGDVDALIVVLNRCFDTQMLEKMGLAAQQRIAKEFTPKVVAERFCDLAFTK